MRRRAPRECGCRPFWPGNLLKWTRNRPRRLIQTAPAQNVGEAEAVVQTLLAFAGVYTSQIAAFRAELDGYEIATIEALLENERRLSQARAAKEAMLEQAYVLEDGRRVFRTADGSAVYDELGQEVGADELDPAVIPEGSPTWEEYTPFRDEVEMLKAERQALLDFQEKLDAARAALDAGEITQAQLDEIRADLIASMPDAVRAQLPQDHPAVMQTAQTEADPAPETAPNKGPSLDGLQGFAPVRPGG